MITRMKSMKMMRTMMLVMKMSTLSTRRSCKSFDVWDLTVETCKMVILMTALHVVNSDTKTVTKEFLHHIICVPLHAWESRASLLRKLDLSLQYILAVTLQLCQNVRFHRCHKYFRTHTFLSICVCVCVFVYCFVSCTPTPNGPSHSGFMLARKSAEALPKIFIKKPLITSCGSEDAGCGKSSL